MVGAENSVRLMTAVVSPGWFNNPLKRNNQFWGRGNGWIAMAMADCLAVMPEKASGRKQMEAMFKKMMSTLLPLLDPDSGHWLQLPVYHEDMGRGNFIESSSTAMFGYAMARGVKMKLLPAKKFRSVIKQAYEGILENSIVRLMGLLSVRNVCAGTCIGEKEYYYKRNIVEGTEFALGVVLLFNTEYMTK